MNTLDKINIITELKQIVARRNTAFTIIESNDITQTVVSIERKVSAIKHKQKRSQLLNVVKYLKHEVKTITKGNKKIGIFCVCLKMDGNMFFKFIDSKPGYSLYCYDDRFHTPVITQILFSIRSITDQETDRLTKHCDTREYFVDQEIDDNIDMIRTIYCFTNSDSPQDIQTEYLESGKEIVLVVDKLFKPSSVLSICNNIGIPY